MKKNLSLNLLGCFLMILIVYGVAISQTTEFSYQGFLSDNSASANGNFDFEFALYVAASGGAPSGTIQRSNVPVTNGVFSVVLDFGQFVGADRFLEIRVRPAGGGAFTVLAPRSKLLSTPFASFANSSTNAVDSSTLGGIAANQYVLTSDSRLNDSRNPLPNSTNYIQNRTTLQTSANFNINGDGTVGGTLTGGVVNASTQFNLGQNRVLAKVGQNNLFLGTLAGRDNGGIQNTMLGDSAGKTNTGNENVMIGFIAGQDSTSGGFNTFLGSRSGLANLTGSSNTFLGYNTDAGSNNLTNATAIGANSFVESNNSLILGSVNGKNGATVDTNVGIGTTLPGATLDIEGQLPNLPPNIPNLRLTNFGRFSLIRGRSANGTRNNPSATTNGSSILVITADGYTGNAFTGLGQATIQFNASENWSSSANGTVMKFSTTPNGSTSEAIRMWIDNNGFVSIGDLAPARKLDVDGIIRVGSTNGTIGCVEDRDGTVIAGTCASDLRFKKNIISFGSVLSNFSKLRPVNYFWRADEFAEQKFGTKQSFGLIAQEVETLFPDLVSTDAKGFKAINYSKLPLLTIQAVKELKTENDSLREQLQNQQKQLDELKKAVEKLSANMSNKEDIEK